MSPKKKMDRNFKRVMIIAILALLLVSTVSYALLSGSSRTGGGTGNRTAAADSELYAFIAPCDNMSVLSQKTLSDGTNFTYTIPGSYFNFSMVNTVDLLLIIVNHEQKDTQYDIVVYQTLFDAANNTLNMTPIGYNTTEPIRDNTAGQVIMHVNPAFASNNTGFMVALINGDSGENAEVLNYTQINATVYP